MSPGWVGPLRWSVDDDGDASGVLLWDLVDGRVGVVEDATPRESREAWEAAAEWSQDRLDGLEARVRSGHVAQSDGLLLAYRTSLRDAAVRFGVAQGSRTSQAARLFFRQTGLQLGTRPGRVSHRVDTLETLERSLPELSRAYRELAAPWDAVDLAVTVAEGLTAEQHVGYDGPAAEAAASTPFASLKKQLRKIRADVRRNDAAEAAKTVYQRRSLTVDHGFDGEGSLTLTGPIVDIVAMESAIRLGAVAARGAADETRTLGQLQYDIGKDLILEGAKTAANPRARPRPCRTGRASCPRSS